VVCGFNEVLQTILEAGGSGVEVSPMDIGLYGIDDTDTTGVAVLL